MIILQKIQLNHLFTMQKSEKASDTKKNQPRKKNHKMTPPPPPLHQTKIPRLFPRLIILFKSILVSTQYTRSLIRMQNDKIFKRGMGVRFCIAHYYKYCVMRTKMGSYKM